MMSPLRVIEPKTMKPDKGREGGHKIRKMSRRRFWMAPNISSENLSRTFGPVENSN